MTSTLRSSTLFRRARQVLAGGVSSPVRAFGAVGGTPRVLARAEGARVEDVDGNTYLDFVGSWGPLIAGHAHPEVVEAVCRAAARGLTFGAPCADEISLAEEVVSSYPGLEQIRFVSSGTEATMSALRLARGATGRDLAVKFSGCYHGHVDALLVAAGSGASTFGNPTSAGVPASVAADTRILPLDDEGRLAELFAAEGNRVAAVIVEPVPANHGLLVQRPEFLEAVRRETRRHGALLIFDEVITGFRLGPGGAAERYGIEPDLAAFGKVIGGGMPVGAFGGSRELMRHLAPEGPVYQAGTLSGNPVAMAAGLANLRILRRDQGWARLEELGQRLEDGLEEIAGAADLPLGPVRMGSIFWLSLQEGPPPRAAEAIDPAAAKRYRPLFHDLLERGITMAPSALEVGFLSLAHRPGDLDRFLHSLGEVLAGQGKEIEELAG